MPDKQELSIFISYAHRDRHYFKVFEDELRAHSSHRKDYIWDIWTDIEISTGADWRQQIEGAIEKSNIALLLVSANFLRSEFCTVDELEAFIRKREEGGFIYIPVLIGECDFAQFEALGQVQFFRAYGDEYNVPCKRGEMIALADLVRFTENWEALPNSSRDRFFMNLVGDVEETIKKNHILRDRPAIVHKIDYKTKNYNDTVNYDQIKDEFEEQSGITSGYDINELTDWYRRALKDIETRIQYIKDNE